jgi:hypothetical protein
MMDGSGGSGGTVNGFDAIAIVADLVGLMVSDLNE